MARIRIFLVLVLALTAGGAFAFGTYRYIQQVPDRAEGIATKPVIVAAVNLDLGAELRPEDLRIVEWPANAVPATAFGSADQVVGRGLIQSVVENEPILPSKLAPKEAGAGLPPVIPAGMRAAVGARQRRRRRCRLRAARHAGGRRRDREPDAAAARHHLEGRADQRAGARRGHEDRARRRGGKPMAVSVVTLLVDPIEAERLTLASTEGKIQLALRNPLDKSAPVTPGIKPAALMGSAVPAPRRAARTAPRPVQAAPRLPAAGGTADRGNHSRR